MACLALNIHQKNNFAIRVGGGGEGAGTKVGMKIQPTIFAGIFQWAVRARGPVRAATAGGRA